MSFFFTWVYFTVTCNENPCYLYLWVHAICILRIHKLCFSIFVSHMYLFMCTCFTNFTLCEQFHDIFIYIQDMYLIPFGSVICFWNVINKIFWELLWTLTQHGLHHQIVSSAAAPYQAVGSRRLTNIKSNLYVYVWICVIYHTWKQSMCEPYFIVYIHILFPNQLSVVFCCYK